MFGTQLVDGLDTRLQVQLIHFRLPFGVHTEQRNLANMDVTHTEVRRVNQFARDFLLLLQRIRGNGTAQELHRGVRVVVVVAVGVEHQQRTRHAVEASHIVIRQVQLLHELHLRHRHADILHLVQPTEREHIIAGIHLVLQFTSVLLTLVFIVHAETKLLPLVLANEQLDATTLGGIVECLRFLGLNEGQCVRRVLQRRDAPEAVLVAVGVAEMQHVTLRHFDLVHDTELRQVCQVVGTVDHIVAAADRQPQRLRVAEDIALNVDEAVAELQAVDVNLQPHVIGCHDRVRLYLQQVVSLFADAGQPLREVALLEVLAAQLHRHLSQRLGAKLDSAVNGRNGQCRLRIAGMDDVLTERPAFDILLGCGLSSLLCRLLLALLNTSSEYVS